MRVAVAALLSFSLVLPLCGADAEVTIVREPVYALDARAIVGASRIMARTRFRRVAASPIVRELAKAAANGHASALEEYERFFRRRLTVFLHEAPGQGIRTDDAGDARARFMQIAFKVYDGKGFDNPIQAFSGAGLWGEGAIAGMSRASASLARLEFILRIKFIMGANKRFAALSDAGKQRVYDFYAIASALLVEGYTAAIRTRDVGELAFIRKQAARQLKADLGVDPERVRFTLAGIEIN